MPCFPHFPLPSSLFPSSLPLSLFQAVRTRHSVQPSGDLADLILPAAQVVCSRGRFAYADFVSELRGVDDAGILIERCFHPPQHADFGEKLVLVALTSLAARWATGGIGGVLKRIQQGLQVRLDFFFRCHKLVVGLTVAERI